MPDTVPLPTPRPPSVFTILARYRVMIMWLVVLSVIANGLTLVLPKLSANAIDAYTQGASDMSVFMLQFGVLTLGIFGFTYLQNIVQTYASERVARDLRGQLVDKISRQHYAFIEEKNPATLLTNLTSDIDAIKMFVAQAIASLISSAVIIIGAAIILLLIDWRLALIVLTIIPIIGGTFFTILRLVRRLFRQGREVIDWLNRVINESILGAALIRVLNANHIECEKFESANSEARTIGEKILRLFSFMVPIITFVSSAGTLMVVTLGGYYVIQGTMTLGSFSAFMGYITLLIFPILVIGFISNIIAQANTAYARIAAISGAADAQDTGTIVSTLHGGIELRDVTMMYGSKAALQSVSLTIKPGTKTAIIGPTAAGKTQLLNSMTGLTLPQQGEIYYDGQPLTALARSSFYPQIGLVFQDSVLFHTTVRENIAFSTTVTDEALKKAIATAELTDFIAALPQGLDTLVSERGTSLSGGQKQRLMLARALALNPKILYLDDFTARVDAKTERTILANIERNYPGITLISITQKIAPVMSYDQIIVLMEGEILAAGTHTELLHASPEYVQIYDSQRSTNTYELHA